MEAVNVPGLNVWRVLRNLLYKRLVEQPEHLLELRLAFSDPELYGRPAKHDGPDYSPVPAV